MLRASFVVDGLNVYSSLCKASDQLGLGGPGTKWLDLRKLLTAQLNVIKRHVHASSRIEVGGIHYFTSIPGHFAASDPDKLERHQRYVECLQADGISVEFGRFHLKNNQCQTCNAAWTFPVEKETDVNLAVKMIDLVVHQNCDILVLVSGDSDICPAVRWIKAFNPELKLVTVFPYARSCHELEQLTHATIRLKPASYTNNQFPDPYIPYPGRRIEKPINW